MVRQTFQFYALALLPFPAREAAAAATRERERDFSSAGAPARIVENTSPCSARELSLFRHFSYLFLLYICFYFSCARAIFFWPTHAALSKWTQQQLWRIKCGTTTTKSENKLFFVLQNEKTNTISPNEKKGHLRISFGALNGEGGTCV